jgi:hypothetical protein
MAKLKDLVVAIGANTTDFDKKLGKSMHKIKAFGKNTKALGKQLSMNLTAPIAALGGLAVKTAADFEFSMAKVAAVSGFTAAEMQSLEAQAKALGGSTSKSASEVAQLQLELAKLGNTAPEIKNMTESVLSLSIAFDTDLGQTAEVVGATLNQFGLEASEAGRVADNMAILFGSSALDLGKFDIAMRTVGPTANALGISLEDTGSALGLLVNAGVDASTAGTALTKAFTTLVQNGTPVNEVLQKLVSGNLSVAEGFELFGDRAGKIIPVLQGTSAEVAALTEKQIEGSGAALQARKVLEDTAQGGFDALRSAVEAAGISIGEQLLPLVKSVAQRIADFATRVSELNPKIIQAAAVFAGLVAVIGPLIFITGQLIQSMYAIRMAALAMSGPVGLVVAGIGLFAGAVSLYMSSAKDADEEVEKLKKGIEGLNEAEAKRFEENRLRELTKELEEERKTYEALKNQVLTGDAVERRVHQQTVERHRMKIDGLQESIVAIKQEIDNKEWAAMADERLAALAQERAVVEGTVADEVERQRVNMERMVTAQEKARQAAEKMRKAFQDAGVAEAIQPMRGGQGERGLMMAGDRANTNLGLPSLDSVDRTADEVENRMEEMNLKMSSIANAISGNLTNAFSSLFRGLMDGTQSFGEFMKQVLTDLLIKLASMAAAFLLISALLPGSTIAQGGFGAFLQGGFGLTGFADGGIVSGPTAALVGEYSGARTNPEVIAPLDKLQSMIQGAGGGNVTVTGRLSGRDILLSSERSNFERNRVRGF